MRVASLLVAVVLWSCKLEDFADDKVTISFDAAHPNAELLANGEDSATLTLDLGTEPTPGKALTVTTTRGFLSVDSKGADLQIVTLTTGAARTMTVLLRAGDSVGEGLISVTSADGVRGEKDFKTSGYPETLHVVPVDGSTSLVANGLTSTRLRIELQSSRKRPQPVSVETTLGSFAAGPAPGAQKQTLNLGGGDSAEVTLLAGSTVGIANVIASVAGGARDDHQISLIAPDSELTLTPSLASIPADSKSVTQLLVALVTTSPGPQVVTLTTNLGELDRSAVGDARRSRKISVRGAATSEKAAALAFPLPLYAAAESGAGIVTATTDQGARAQTEIDFTYAAATRLALAVTPSVVLSQAVQQATVTSEFSRGFGPERPSHGVRLGFAICCAPSAPACNSLFLLPPSAAVPDGNASHPIPLQLSVLGLTRAAEEGTPPLDNVSGMLHGFVLDGTRPSPTCAQLSLSETPAGVSATAAVEVQVARKPTN